MQYPEPCLVGMAWSWHHGGTYFSFYGSVSQPAFLAASALTEVEILIMRCPGVFLDLFNTANLGRFTVAPPPLLFTFPFFSFRAIRKLPDDLRQCALRFEGHEALQMRRLVSSFFAVDRAFAGKVFYQLSVRLVVRRGMSSQAGGMGPSAERAECKLQAVLQQQNAAWAECTCAGAAH